MTDTPPRFGRLVTYPLRGMVVGETARIPAPTPADVKRIARNVSQYGIRHHQAYRCKTDRQTRIMTITRIR